MTVSLPVGYKAVSLVIKGRVQGVWFRAWTTEKSQMLGLDGWVRNTVAGDVEAVFVGPSGPVDEIIIACRSGPPLARVDDIEIHELPAQEAVGLLNSGFG